MSLFEINNVKLVTSWSHVLTCNTDCTICRKSLNTYSIFAKDMKLEEINIITGCCGHSFHKECLEPWLKTQNKCPICSKKNMFHLN
jgi:E3 ubiquitin-protein ligase RBX1